MEIYHYNLMPKKEEIFNLENMKDQPSRRYKILFINTGPWGTGSFTVVHCLSNELIKLGHEVKIFFPDGDCESIDKDEYYSNSNLYKIWKFPLKNGKTSINNFPLMIPDPHPRNPQGITFNSLINSQQHLYEKELEKELSELINEYNPDIIECHHIWYPAWILKRLGFPYLLTAHHSDQMGFRFDKKVREKAIASANFAHKIIAISKSVEEEIQELYQVHKEKIELIPNGYDKEVFKVFNVNKKALLKQLKIDLDPKARIISFAGKLSWTKGIDILLEANRLLDLAKDIHFIVMGAGSLKEIIEQIPADSYRLDNLHFVGQQPPERVAEIHNISEFSIMPSRNEGFGIACLEAMACGLPVIVSRCDGPEHFAVGKVISQESAEELARAINEFLRLEKNELDQLKKEALRVAEQFSMRAITEQHLKLYDSLYSERLCPTRY